MSCMRCKCISKTTGKRCKNKTCKYLPTCWIHARQRCSPITDDKLIENLFIKKSNIKHAGMGLFTRSYIRKGTVVGLYCGKIVSSTSRGPYVMNCNMHNISIDAEDKHLLQSTALRYANSWRSSSTLRRRLVNHQGRQVTRLYNNIKIISRPNRVRPLCCTIKSTRNIQPGEELLLSYGRSYMI